MAHPSVAQQLVDMVRQAGARRIYGGAGDSLNPIVDAVRRTQGIQWVHVSGPQLPAHSASSPVTWGFADHVARRTAEGKTSREIKRCLARYVARDLCRLLESRAAAA